MNREKYFETVPLEQALRAGLVPDGPPKKRQVRGGLLPVRRESMGSRLQSWTEIARFISSGVRTAQRYERELGLPVHRDQESGPVWADPNELLNWVRGFNAPNRLPDGLESDAPARTGGRRLASRKRISGEAPQA